MWHSLDFSLTFFEHVHDWFNWSLLSECFCGLEYPRGAIISFLLCILLIELGMFSLYLTILHVSMINAVQYMQLPMLLLLVIVNNSPIWGVMQGDYQKKKPDCLTTLLIVVVAQWLCWLSFMARHIHWFKSCLYLISWSGMHESFTWSFIAAGKRAIHIIFSLFMKTYVVGTH